MNEAVNNPENVKSDISKFAIISLLLGTLGISILLIRANFYRLWWNEYVARNLVLLFGISGLITGYTGQSKTSAKKWF